MRVARLFSLVTRINLQLSIPDSSENFLKMIGLNSNCRRMGERVECNKRIERRLPEFRKGSVDVYNVASFGWCYWTLKNDGKHWDFEWNIKNNYLELGKLLMIPLIIYHSSESLCQNTDANIVKDSTQTKA